MAKRKTKKPKTVDALTHDDAKRPNLPSAEYQDALDEDLASPFEKAYQHRNADLDPQLVWRGKDVVNPADLVVQVPPLFIQEKVHPKVLVDDLLRRSRKAKAEGAGATVSLPENSQLDLFADFNGIAEEGQTTEFYEHEANWTNRMILGDSLHVMASLAEREGLRGKAQCIYLDPPYGIKFNSNFQWSTTSRDVKDGKREHITRDPEMVKAFRDTWRDGIHSYLSYLRDRLLVARELLTESGSIFVQIGDENVHRVRAVMDEVFGEENFVSQINFKSMGALGQSDIPNVYDYLIWYSKDKSAMKFRPLYRRQEFDGDPEYRFIADPSEPIGFRTLQADEERPEGNGGLFRRSALTSSGFTPSCTFSFDYQGRGFTPFGRKSWRTNAAGMDRLKKGSRMFPLGDNLYFRRFASDSQLIQFENSWTDAPAAAEKIYVVQTAPKFVERCLLMTTDPGDLVLDPTCGSGTTVFVAEQWGRRWITIDTSRVALALARARIMGAKYPWYQLADSAEGQKQIAKITGKPPKGTTTSGNVRHGFVYKRVPHVMLKDIANNAEIDALWEKHEKSLEPLRQRLTEVVGTAWLKQYRADKNYDVELPNVIQEWEVPRDCPEEWAEGASELHDEFWQHRIARQREIDESIARNAEFEYLYDQPYEDKSKVRVAGPFTVESMMPHREVALDEDDRPLLDSGRPGGGVSGPRTVPTEHADFAEVILEHLKSAGVQQAHKEDRITFSSLAPWPGKLVCAEGRFEAAELPLAGGKQAESKGKGGGLDTDHRPLTTYRAAIFIGPEFGSVMRQDLVDAAEEAADAGFDVLIACAFAYGPHAADVSELGGLPILKARMNADLHMSKELADTGKGNLFVIFGEPDVSVASGQWLVASGGRMVANYEQVKELSGLGSLAAINDAGRGGLSSFSQVPAGGEVRSGESGSPGGGLDRGEHRGRGRADGDEGISSVPGNRERVARGNGDPSDAESAAGSGESGGDEAAAGGGGNRRQDAEWAQTVAALKGLKESDFPLNLTTGHCTRVTIHGVDVFKPQSGKVVSDNRDGIACWMIDTDYNGQSFFVRHAYFLGQNDPYKSLKTSLKAEIDKEAWASLNSPISRPFPKPESGRIAVKVINHLGDEVMKVYRVE